MGRNSSLGERMKMYELQSRTTLLRKTPVIIRLDGKAFHTFTKGLEKPFDGVLTRSMRYTMLKLCENIQGCVLGYTQSDEITLVLVDYKNLDSCAWFDNQVQKIVSIASSIATSAFNEFLYFEPSIDISNSNSIWYTKKFKANFDARAFNVPIHEVVNCLIWRQQDAIRNSIQALAQSLFPHKELQGLKANELQDKMFTEKGINWNDLHIGLKRGSCCKKDEEGYWIIDTEIPIFTENREYINNLIDPEVICNG